MQRTSLLMSSTTILLFSALLFSFTPTEKKSLCDPADKPSFGFSFNGIPTANINNGSADPSESATIVVCDGEQYSTWGHFQSSTATLYDLAVNATGGVLLFNNSSAAYNTVLTGDQLFATAGTYSINLADPAVGGQVIQTITPFTDLNNNGTLDDGDCAGEPIVYTYVSGPKTTWYKDADSDNHAAETIQACAAPGEGWTTTVLPVDDCNDDDPNNAGPVLGFNFNGKIVRNINNGTTDPGESATFIVCESGSYTVSDYFHSNAASSYYVENIASGGTLLFNGVPAYSGTGLYTVNELSNLAGSYAVSLADMNTAGTLKQSITPFIDVNSNGVPDGNDCIGEKIAFTYTANVALTWYQDNDGDGYGNAQSATKTCTQPAGYVKNNYDCDDNKKSGRPWKTEVVMCRNGVSDCVDAKDIWKRLFKGWKLGPCETISCSGNKIVMCHDGKQECVNTKDVYKKLCEPGNHWTIGACSSNNRPGSVTGIQKKLVLENDGELLPEKHKLSNYPNPFAGSSTIRYELPFDSRVSIKVYDQTGRVVATLVNADKKAGTYTVDFNARRQVKGTLYYKIIARSKNGQFEQTNKMMQLK